ncbi:hypothetical protein Q9314_13400 [Shinella sumterensis]|nr:hypothetical protein Q9314_13400 [Shinella sumterensis]
MTTTPKTNGPASAATDPDRGSINPLAGKTMNTETNTTPSHQESCLCDLIAEAESIAAQIRTSADDAQVAVLSSNLLELNNHIIRAPCGSLEDVQGKATYLLASNDPLDAGVIEPLLCSLAGKVSA